MRFLSRRYYKVVKYEGKYMADSKRFSNYYHFNIQKFDTKKEAKNAIKGFMKEEFHPLHRLILYWITIGIYLIVFILSLIIIGKFMHGGLMELSVPRLVSKYISTGAMMALFISCMVVPKINKYLGVIELKIQNFILRD